MYNIDFLPQIEKSRRVIFGAGCFDREIIEEAARRYMSPANLKVIECHEDINGEWVPNPVKSNPTKPNASELEKKTS